MIAMNDYSVKNLISKGSFKCSCGKIHSAHLKDACICENALDYLPEYIEKLGGNKAYILADANTVKAGKSALDILDKKYKLELAR